MSFDPNQPGSNPFADKGANPYASPTPVGGGAPDARRSYPPGSVPNYLVHSILCLLFCCWPFAIPAIVYAAQVNTKLAQGDYNGAIQSSNNAKKWCTVAVGCWAVGFLAYVLFIFIVVVASAA